MAMAKTAATDVKEVIAEIPHYFKYYSDGTLIRTNPLPLQPPSTSTTSSPPSTQAHSNGVASRDIVLNSDLGLWARIFFPQQNQNNDNPSHGKLLPVVVYFHGGAFILGDPNWIAFHAFCADMASRSNSIWISVSYRLAPEHPLPTAYEDCYSALQWLKSQSLQAPMDPWLALADFSECFLCGESAGGNIVHHVALRFSNEDPSLLKPLCIRGLVMIHPGFVREDKTQEELDAPQDVHMNWKSLEVFKQLSSPIAAENHNLDYWNPLPEIYSGKKSLPFPKSLVAVAEQDMMYIMGKEYVKALKAVGNHVDAEISKGVGHVFHLYKPESEEAIALKQKITDFIYGTN